MADRPTLRLDFGVPVIPGASGYVGIGPLLKYPGNVGLGWESGDVQSRDNGGDSPARDLCVSKDAVFRVDLPDGAYDVTIHSQDNWDHYYQEFSLDGEVVASFGLDHLHPYKATFWHEVKGGTLRLRMRDAKGEGGECVLNALEIVPTDRAKPVPPTPWEAAVAKWRGNMTSHGDAVAGNIMSKTVGTLDSYGDTFYDAARVFYQVADETKDPKWAAVAEQAAKLYREGYVFWDNNNGGVYGYWVFTRGLRMHFERTGDQRSKDAVIALATNGPASSDKAKLEEWAGAPSSREVAYAIESHLDAEALGEPRRTRTDALVAVAKGHINQWLEVPRTNPYYYVRPFMVGLTCDALIAYDAAHPDPTILPAVRRILDHIWETCWLPEARCFKYTDVPSPDDTGGMEPAPDLNLLICPAYAWVYEQTGDSAWKDRADAIFMGGVDGTVTWDSKHYCQQYRWSFDYLDWRGGEDGAVVPTPPPTPPAEPGLLPKARSFVVTFPSAVPAGRKFRVDIARDGTLKADWVP